MKFFVEVNALYLVSMTAESALEAEHACLDLEGVWGAMAFDAAMCSTETFRGVLASCSTISLEELRALSVGYTEIWKKANNLDAEAEAATAEERRLHDQLQAAIERRKEACKAAVTALLNAHEWEKTAMNISDEHPDPRHGRR